MSSSANLPILAVFLCQYCNREIAPTGQCDTGLSVRSMGRSHVLMASSFVSKPGNDINANTVSKMNKTDAIRYAFL